MWQRLVSEFQAHDNSVNCQSHVLDGRDVRDERAWYIVKAQIKCIASEERVGCIEIR